MVEIRDNRQGNWLWIHNAIVRKFDLTPYQLAVYVGLACFADNREQSSFPGIKTLAQSVGMSERKCRAVLRELENLGLIATEKRYRDDGSQTSNIYILLDPPMTEPQSPADLAGEPAEPEPAQDATPPASPAAPPSPGVPPPPASHAAKQDPINKTNITMFGGGKTINNPSSLEPMTEPDPAALEALILAGVSDVVASKLAGSCDSAAVVGWCAYVETAKGVEDPPALIVARLKAGVPPPKPKSDRPPVQTGGFVNGEPPERKPKPEPTEAERIWTAAQGELSGSLSPDTWESVIRPLEAVELNDGTLTLTGTLAAVEWARLRLAGQIQQAVEATAGRPVKAEFRETQIDDK